MWMFDRFYIPPMLLQILCHSYDVPGYCSHGSSCNFAHGRGEIGDPSEVLDLTYYQEVKATLRLATRVGGLHWANRGELACISEAIRKHLLHQE